MKHVSHFIHQALNEVEQAYLNDPMRKGKADKNKRREKSNKPQRGGKRW
jgi:hypothetical protein